MLYGGGMLSSNGGLQSSCCCRTGASLSSHRGPQRTLRLINSCRSARCSSWSAEQGSLMPRMLPHATQSPRVPYATFACWVSLLGCHSSSSSLLAAAASCAGHCYSSSPCQVLVWPTCQDGALGICAFPCWLPSRLCFLGCPIQGLPMLAVSCAIMGACKTSPPTAQQHGQFVLNPLAAPLPAGQGRIFCEYVTVTTSHQPA
jgi:hypothetical protein